MPFLLFLGVFESNFLDRINWIQPMSQRYSNGSWEFQRPTFKRVVKLVRFVHAYTEDSSVKSHFQLKNRTFRSKKSKQKGLPLKFAIAFIWTCVRLPRLEDIEIREKAAN